MKTNYETVKDWRSRNKDKVAEQSRRYRAKHPETHVRAVVKYRKTHLEELRTKDREAARLRRQTPEYKEAQRVRNLKYKAKLRSEQEAIAGRPCPDLCELCGGSESRIVFDHCHLKGHFRGWICDRCNRVLGSVKDDVILLGKMITYLETT